MDTFIVQSIRGMFDFVLLYTVLRVSVVDIMKDPVWSARIKNKKIILSSERTAQNQNHQTKALLTSIKVENTVEGQLQKRPTKDGSKTDLYPVYEEKCEKTPSPSKPKHNFETQPPRKTEAVPYMEHSQCLTLSETDAAIDEESGWYESHDEQSYEIKRDDDDDDDDDDTNCLPEAIDKQNHDNLDMDTKNENFDQDFLAEVHSTERHGIDLPFSGTVVKEEKCVGDLTMQNASTGRCPKSNISTAVELETMNMTPISHSLREPSSITCHTTALPSTYTAFKEENCKKCWQNEIIDGSHTSNHLGAHEEVNQVPLLPLSEIKTEST